MGVHFPDRWVQSFPDKFDPKAVTGYRLSSALLSHRQKQGQDETT